MLRHKIELVVLDSKTGSFINTALFAEFQFKNNKNGKMELPFVVKDKSGIQILISNVEGRFAKKTVKVVIKKY